MLRLPLNKIHTFIKLREREGKEVVTIGRSKSVGLSSIIVPVLCRGNNNGLYAELMDIRNLLPIGMSILLEGSGHKALNNTYRAQISMYPIFNINNPDNVGMWQVGRYDYKVNSKCQSFGLKDLWPRDSSGQTYFPLRTSNPGVQHIHSLMNAIVMRDYLIKDVTLNMRRDEVTWVHRKTLESVIKALNKDIIKLIDSYPLIDNESADLVSGYV